MTSKSDVRAAAVVAADESVPPIAQPKALRKERPKAERQNEKTGRATATTATGAHATAGPGAFSGVLRPQTVRKNQVKILFTRMISTRISWT
ncbi:MAG TPA: hypothetical protein VGM76_19195 [Lacipirellulaceae bacterium]